MSECVYRSEAPEVAEWWADRERRYQAFRTAATQLRDDFPGADVLVTTYASGAKAICGLRADARPGPGWRRARGEQAEYWMPNCTSEAGRILGKRLAGIRFDNETLPGMPGDLFDEETMALRTHSLCCLGGASWVLWKCEPEEVEADYRFDGSLWQRAPMSAYWLAKEAQEAAEARAAAPEVPCAAP